MVIVKLLKTNKMKGIRHYSINFEIGKKNSILLNSSVFAHSLREAWSVLRGRYSCPIKFHSAKSNGGSLNSAYRYYSRVN